MSIPAHEKRVLKVSKVAGSNSVEVELSYRLVNEEVRTLLELKEQKWTEKHFIAKESLKLN
jgi:hypothetical protein